MLDVDVDVDVDVIDTDTDTDNDSSRASRVSRVWNERLSDSIACYLGLGAWLTIIRLVRVRIACRTSTVVPILNHRSLCHYVIMSSMILDSACCLFSL